MNRRDLLLATSGALVCAASGNVLAMNGRGLPSASTAGAFSSDCSLIPIQPAPANAAGLREIRLRRFFPSQTDGPGQLEYLSIDLQLLDDRQQMHTIYAWQMVRRSCASCAGGFRMTLPGRLTNLVVNQRQRGAKTTHAWSGRPLLGLDSILATARTSTGRAPLAIDLRLDPVTLEPSMVDGSPRDFDALLLSAV